MSKQLLSRLRILRTGICEWSDPDTGDIEVDFLGWRDRWSIFGVHSYNWRWVRRYGKQTCGCTLNPLTRRVVLVSWECPKHCGIPS
jgi:hypothetical protein